MVREIEEYKERYNVGVKQEKRNQHEKEKKKKNIKKKNRRKEK